MVFEIMKENLANMATRYLIVRNNVHLNIVRMF
jgi:hypothetical protein